MSLNMIAVDTHAHVFTQHDECIATARYTPNYDANIDTFLAHLDAHGLSHGVLVQPSFFGNNNQVMLKAIQHAPERLKGIAVVDHNIDLTALAQLKAQGVVGVRINLFGLAVPDLKQAQWQTFLKHLEQLNFQLELHAPPADLIQMLPALKQYHINVVIDHFGRPELDKGLADPDYQKFLSLLDPKQHWIKVSAFYRLAQTEQQLSVAQDAFEQLQARGLLKKMIWGSDWPHTQHESSVNYQHTFAMLQQIVPDPEQQALILDRNTAELFQL